MEENLWNEYKKTSRMIISPHFLIPIVIAGIIIIVISIFLEYYSRKQDYLNQLKYQAELFITTLTNTSQKSLQAADVLESEIHRRMLTNLQLISALNAITPFSKERLKLQQQESQFERLDIYDKDGKCIVSVADSNTFGEIIPSDILADVNNGFLDEIIIAPEYFTESESSTNRFTALVHRREGGSVVGIISSEYIRTFRQLYGFGRFFKDFKRTAGVEYVILENPETIIAGIFEPYTISKFSEDQFLNGTMNQTQVRTRILQYEQQSVFEAVSPFSIQNESIGVLRLGLSMKQYEILNARAKKQLVITGLIILIVCISILSFYLSYSQRQIFRESFIRLRKYTNLILENMGSGVVAVGSNGDVQLANRQAADILNIDQNDVIGKNIEVFPDDIVRICRESIDNMTEIRQPRYIWYKGNTESLRISLRTTLLMKGTAVETCIFLIDDTTEQARLEEQLHRQEKLTAMGKLAAGVAHEIGNPLNSIGLIMQFLNKKFASDKIAEQYSSRIQTVEKEINRINEIVNQFIRFARPPEIHKEPLKFQNFFKELEQLFLARFEENQINFELRIDSHPPSAGDHDQLKQAFINLIENGIQAIDPPGTITITGKPFEDYFEIRIKDTGCGISEENLPNVFDLYFTTKKKGTGIGLAVVHQIISGHGGSIKTESKQSYGTTFIIRLPYTIQV